MNICTKRGEEAVQKGKVGEKEGGPRWSAESLACSLGLLESRSMKSPLSVC